MNRLVDSLARRRFAGIVIVLAGLLLAGVTRGAGPSPVDNPHGSFHEECSHCHTADTWKVAKVSPKFDHARYGFPLEGAHASANCMTCHTSLEFAQARTQCASCHQDPHRGEMGVDCAHCHGARSFTDRGPMVRAHQLTRFPLTGSHAGLDCESCHPAAAQGHLQFVGTTTECQSCHIAQYRTAKNPDHVAGAYPLECQTCHGMTGWTSATFNHDATPFPLTGAHRAAACASCHGDGVYAGKSTTCQSCHMPDYNRASPNHAAAGFAAAACASCHGTTSFANATFDHNATQFPLTGAHVATACASCHGDGVYAGKPTTCISCHSATYATAQPPHQAAGFDANACATCHTTAQWQRAPFDHSTTQFPLTGAHVAAACASCHGDGVYAGKPTTCISCHNADYTAAVPPHTATSFPTAQCATCHTTTTFANATFDHNTTQFPLTGAHIATACSGCHGDGVYAGKPTTCISCHSATYATAQPPHQAAGFDANACATCHTTAQWQRAPFDHNTTQFPLTGAHVATACASCHGDGVYAGKPTTCISCHNADYTAAVPPHTATSFPTAQCATCHTTTTFANATFDHNTTQFPLTGAHIATTCSGCHGDGVYAGKPTTCISCHSATYTTAQPPHQAAGFDANACATCHTTAQWQRAPFDHSTTQFPLTGAHVAAACASCHGDGVYAGKPTTCISCHNADYTAAVPPHTATSFPTAQCASCHTTTTFANATFDHNTTQFPLTGAHVATACSGCHGDGVYAGKPTTCISCHSADYNTAVPPHTAATFPTNACASCHTTTTFANATFDHNTTQFPLTGAHVATACSGCHGDGVYAGKPTTCISCHQTDYDNATPNHAAAAFATSACTSCHNTTQWTGARYTAHDASYFPIYSGRHNGTWASCATCHTSGSNFAVFTCLSCHPHDNKTQTDSNHNGQNGYSYDSNACYRCHPTGRSG